MPSRQIPKSRASARVCARHSTTRNSKSTVHENNDAGDWRTMELPPFAAAAETDDYKLVEIDSASAEYGELLVDLATFGLATQAFFARRDYLNAPICAPFKSAMTKVYARSGIADRLLKVNRSLARYGVELLILDGYRPISVQEELWQWFMGYARRVLGDVEPQSLKSFVLRYCSEPSQFDIKDATTWPTHSTGGAVDVTLRDKRSKAPLHMGSIYLDPDTVSATRFFEESDSRARLSDEEARRNRRLLFWAMHSAGFVNYAFEWWHFDSFTQAWVYNQGCPANLKARYGLAQKGLAVARNQTFCTRPTTK